MEKTFLCLVCLLCLTFFPAQIQKTETTAQFITATKQQRLHRVYNVGHLKNEPTCTVSVRT